MTPSPTPMPKTVLLDKRNYDQLVVGIKTELAGAAVIGLDIETEDSNKHEGLKQLSEKTIVFDINRTVLCGLSLYVENSDVVYYLNHGHADIENRLTTEQVLDILSAIPEEATVIAHNLQFELVNLWNTIGYDIKNGVCTFQMAVSAFNADQYNPDDLRGLSVTPLGPVMQKARLLFAGFTREMQQRMTQPQVENMIQFIGKQSKAKHSYNGWIQQICYGYGLKSAVKKFFGHQMATFKETLAAHGAQHMGQLTGEQTADYGADDAYWAVRLYRRLIQFMMDQQPRLLRTFFEVENPMVYEYARVWQHGVVIDPEAVEEHRQREIREGSEFLQELRTLLRKFGDFPSEPNPELLKREKWYAKNVARYRDQVRRWIDAPVNDDPKDELRLVRGAVTYAGLGDQYRNRKELPSIMYYMTLRVILHDLLGIRPVIVKRKLASDQDARTTMKERETDPDKVRIFELLASLASCDQNLKLYLTPYQKFLDPDTGKIHPEIVADKNTRRTGMKNPNAQQLAKRNPKSQYIRGFYKPDSDDHVIVARDWSSIELVLIAEFSKDPVMVGCYSSLPHKDQHKITASNLAGFRSLEEFMALLKTALEDYDGSVPLTNDKGEQLTPKEYYKWARGVIGKGGNFEFWYSGWLGKMSVQMRWTDEKTREKVEAFITLYEVGNQWRINTINQGRSDGYVELPDYHRRVRYEATYAWQTVMKAKLDGFGVNEVFIDMVLRKIATRAGNQMINALIQGSCATIIKRSILRFSKCIKEMAAERGFDNPDRLARFMFPIHDEIVLSVHKDHVQEVTDMLYEVMCDHPDIFKDCVPDSSLSVGLNFAPYNKETNPAGQIEMDEEENQHLTIGEVVDNLFTIRKCVDA